MALVVMGKRIAQHRMPNPRKPRKLVKQPTPTTWSTAAEEQPPLHKQPLSHTSQMSTPSLHLPLAIRRDPLATAEEAQLIALTEADTSRLGCAYARVLMQRRDNDARARETTRGSDVDLGRGRGHAPRAQGRTSPDRNPPTAEHYTQVMAQIDAEHNPPTADAYARVIERDDNSQSRQTARWSGGGPGRSCGHAPRAQGRTPPERDPLPADTYAQTIVRVDNDNDQPHQTARWSGGSPSRGHGFAPQADTAGRTQPCKMAR
jgi:hypothetical protein